MKRSEAVHKLSLKLRKSKNLFDGYKKGNITLESLCDNLSDRALRHCEDKLGLTPPERKVSANEVINSNRETVFSEEFLSGYTFWVSEWEWEEEDGV